MRKAIILATLTLALSIIPTFAQEEATSAGEEITPVPEAISQAPVEYLYPGLLPDNPLYFLKSLVYTIRGFFVFGSEAKARWYLKLADKRIAEARELAKKGEDVLAVRASEKAVAMRDKAVEHVEVVKAQGRDIEALVEKLEVVSIRQQAVFDQVLEEVPEQARNAIRQTKEESRRRLERAIEVLQGKEATPAAEEGEIGCEMLWWFDEDTRVCQKKKFCGMYMYEGLRTFETKEECEAGLED